MGLSGRALGSKFRAHAKPYPYAINPRGGGPSNPPYADAPRGAGERGQARAVIVFIHTHPVAYSIVGFGETAEGKAFRIMTGRSFRELRGDLRKTSEALQSERARQ